MPSGLLAALSQQCPLEHIRMYTCTHTLSEHTHTISRSMWQWLFCYLGLGTGEASLYH